MTSRLVFLLAAPCAALLVATAHAAPQPAPLRFTDQAGDANGVNDSRLWPGSNSPVPEGTTTPVSFAEYDLRSLTIGATGTVSARRVGRKTVKSFRCTGYTATIELAAAPKAAMYRVLTSRADDGNGTLFLEWRRAEDGTSTTELRYIKVVDGVTVTVWVPMRNAAKVSGNRITFVVTAADLKPAGERLEALELFRLGADVRTDVKDVITSVPLWDQLRSGRAEAWKVCPA